MDCAVFYVPANTVQVIWETVFTGQKTQPTVEHFQKGKVIHIRKYAKIRLLFAKHMSLFDKSHTQLDSINSTSL